MRFPRLLPCLALLTTLFAALSAQAEDTVCLFAYFVGTGEDGLHLAWSEDGYRWQPLNGGGSFLAPQVGKDRLMRDPCVMRRPDGTFHLVWTSGWWDQGIGHAATKDFLTWSRQQDVPVMAHEPKARNAWAPEIAWDAKREQFLIFWASTVPGRFPQTDDSSESGLNHRIYCTTTKDWATFTPTRLFCDPGFSVIDATLLPGDDGKFHLIVKDETNKPLKKHLRIGTADDPEGPWMEFAPPFTRGWVEGPTAIKVGADTLVYFDVYREGHYGAMRSRDLAHWEDVTAEISIPRDARHGTMIAVPRSLVERLVAAKPGPERLGRFDAPARQLTPASPLGNGRLGTMVLGGVDEERIILNEAGLWSGSPLDAARPEAAAVLPEIRRRLLAGKNAEAEKGVATNFTCAGAGPASTARPLDPKRPTVFVAGDSTAAKNNGEPIQGWGEPFHDYFDPTKINVVNLARGGRSSRTFITEGWWDRLLTEVKPGDFVLIQFGHNDAGVINAEPPGSTRPLRARGSLPGIGDESEEIDNVLTKRHEVVHTFGWNIRKMIADVKAKGATPIVLSLTVRNIWKDGKVERGSGEYRAWDRAIAQATGVAFVDVTRIIADRFQELGEERVPAFFPKDHTHTNPAGADFSAAAVITGLTGLRGEPWEKLLSEKGRAVPADTIGWLNLPEPVNPALPTLLLIGDSTVRNGRGDGTGGQWGWGEELAAHFDTAKLNVVNRAVGGLSSRTFLTQGHWARALMLLKRGDFVVMQFGHNDDAPLNDERRARGTIKGIGEETQEIDNLITKQHEVVHSYGWYLRGFIHDAKARGITPIVCSPVPRKTWKDGKIVRSTEGHAGWAKQVAVEEGVAFIDLNDLVAQRYEAMGPERVEAMFADEHTHTSRAGAELNAAIVAEALRELPGGLWAKYLRAR